MNMTREITHFAIHKRIRWVWCCELSVGPSAPFNEKCSEFPFIIFFWNTYKEWQILFVYFRSIERRTASISPVFLSFRSCAASNSCDVSVGSLVYLLQATRHGATDASCVDTQCSQKRPLSELTGVRLYSGSKVILCFGASIRIEPDWVSGGDVQHNLS